METLGSSILTGKDASSLPADALAAVVGVNLDRAIALFAEKSEHTRDDAGKWHELVYCILAGSQVPARRVRVIHARLLRARPDLLQMGPLCHPETERSLAVYLRHEGYRYHTQKASVVANAARFFCGNYDCSIAAFLASSDPNGLREELARDVKGLGLKIASHWLRNIGLPVCTIDIHLRRLLRNLGMTVDDVRHDVKPAHFIEMEGVFRQLACSVHLPLGVFQYAVWQYALHRCAYLHCAGCSLLPECARGHKPAAQLRLPTDFDE